MGPIRIKATTPAMPSAISSQANQGMPFLCGFRLVCSLVFALLKVPPRGPSPPSSLVHLEQLDKLVIGKTGISDEPRKQAFGHLALMARNKKRDRSIILVASRQHGYLLDGLYISEPSKRLQEPGMPNDKAQMSSQAQNPKAKNGILWHLGI